MKLVLLGTAGGPRPSDRRSAPAQAIVRGEDLYVVDCGNGVARQIVLAGLRLDRLRAVFLTHHHADHMLDVGALPFLAWTDGLREVVDLFGPAPLRDVMDHFLAMVDVDLRARQDTTGRPRFEKLLNVTEVDRAGQVWSHGDLVVKTACVDHPPIRPSLAYRFETPDRSIVISGDTRYSPALVELATGADVLVHEAFHRGSLDLLARGGNTSTLREHVVACHTEAAEAGRVAQEAQVGLLVLSHLVPADGGPDERSWRQAAASMFSGPVLVGEDLQLI
ncbi:MAG: MBL fold metallo-hydrolase [Acidimicrobiales bacterium]